MNYKIIVNDCVIENLLPIKKSLKNKNKKFSAQGFYNGKKVKIYEVFDKNQGALREFVSNHKELSTYFPKLITYDKKFIVEEWLKGNTLTEIRPGFFSMIKYSFVIKKMIKQMWSVEYGQEVFDYIDYIYKRLGKTCNFDLSKIPIRIINTNSNNNTIFKLTVFLYFLDILYYIVYIKNLLI